MRSKGIISDIAKVITDERDAVKAMAIFEDHYKDHLPRSRMTAYHQIRKEVYDNDENRNKYYAERIEAFRASHQATLTEEDHAKLNELLAMPLKKQNQVEQSFRSYLSTRDLSKELREIRSCIAPLYQFKMPVEWKREAVADIKARRLVLQGVLKDRKNRGHFKITNDDLNTIVEKARSKVIQTSAKGMTKRLYAELVASLMILTGRRLVEICKTLTLYPVENEEFQARVSGIAKTRIGQPTSEVAVIPLLAPFEVLQDALLRIREFRQFFTNEECALKVSPCSSRACVRLFGLKLSHTVRRNIYLEAAYLRREEENHFLVNDKSVPRRQWMNMALYMCPVKLEDIDFYTRMEVVK